MTNNLSAGKHVRDVIGKCAQSLHALKLLRCHGMRDDSPRHVYKAVDLSELLYASPAWWGFTSAADKQRLEATVLYDVLSGSACIHLTILRRLNSQLTWTTTCLRTY